MSTKLVRTYASTVWYSVMTVVWVSTFAWVFWPQRQPLIYPGGDSITPTAIKRGGSVEITRNIKVVREQPVTIVRTLVKGDCEAKCEVVDMPESKVALKVQDLRVQTRPMEIPREAGPGQWLVVFKYEWEDRVGRTHSEHLPILRLTVVE